MPLIIVLLALTLLTSCSPSQPPMNTEDMGNGFFHHGVANPNSNRRGLVATVDGEGHNVVLVWLFDHRGGYAILDIDAATGNSDQIPVPFPPGGDTPYASILSSGNKYYTHFYRHFSEFDPVKKAFTFVQKTGDYPGMEKDYTEMAMAMTEDDQGVIWSATYPRSGLVSFNPKTREFKDYGHLYDQNWNQYPRAIAADDAGWVYFGVGSTAAQILAFDPKAAKATPIIPEAEREQAYPSLYRDMNGKVYGLTKAGGEGEPEGQWLELYKGKAKKISPPADKKPKPEISGGQGLFHATFPDGTKVKELNLIDRKLVIEDSQAGTTVERTFAYTSEGAFLMGLEIAPGGTIAGGTFFPWRFFNFNPKTGEWTSQPTIIQWNTVDAQGDRFFIGGYTGGVLLEWDPAKPWVPTKRGDPNSNPLFLAQGRPGVYRPHELLAHPDGRYVILAGTPDYGLTGGGLLFWDRQTKTSEFVDHTKIIPLNSTHALVALPNGKILGGTTTAPGTGGERKAAEAEMYVMDIAAKNLDWHQVVFPGVQEYSELTPGPRGLVYGITDRTRFFVFDPVALKVVYEKSPGDFGKTAAEQGPEPFVTDLKGNVYLLFEKGIAKVNPDTYELEWLADSPVKIDAGGAFLEGRIYFAGGSHLYSYKAK